MSLTRKQADKIIAVIEQDATARQVYRTKTGEACVIGGLAIAAKAARLLPRIGSRDNDTSIIGMDKLCDRLNAEYGLSDDQLRRLQYINDYYTTVAKRRAALIERVNEWVGA